MSDFQSMEEWWTERVAELERQLAELWEAADRYSDNGHFPDCPVNDWTTGECDCGLAELEPLLQGVANENENTDAAMA